MAITEKKPLLIQIPGERTPNELPITASAVGYDFVQGNYIYYATGSDSWETAPEMNPIYWQSDAPGNIFTTGSIYASGSITGSNLVLTSTSARILAPNDGLTISASNGIFITGSLIVSGTRSDTGTENTSVLFNGDLFVSGGIGLGDYVQLKPVNTLRIPTNTTSSYIYTSGSTNDLYFTQYNGPYTNTTRLRWLESMLSTGLLHGGFLSTATGSTTFSVTSGSGIVLSYNASTTTDPYPTIQKVDWPAYVSQSLTYITSSQLTYIGINPANSQIIQQTTPFVDGDFENYIVLGRVLHQTGSVTNGTATAPAVSYGISTSHDQFVRAFGPLKLSGHVLAASGSTLSLTKTGGDSYVKGRNYTVNPNSPDYVKSTSDFELTTSKIFREYVSGSTPIIDTGIGGAGYTTINPGQYNNNGTLASVSSNDFSVQRVFWFPNAATRALYVYYGVATYGTIAAAQSAILEENFVEGSNTADSAIFVAYIIVKGNATNLSNATQAKIIQAPFFRAAGLGGGGGSGGTTTPGGLDTYVQFNDGGSTFGGVAGLTFNKTTNTLSTTNLVVSSIATVSGNVTLGDASSDVVTSTGQLTASNGLRVVGSAQVSNGVNIAAGGLQVAGVVPGISAPYNNSPLIVDLASGQTYGPVIRSVAGTFNYSALSFDQNGTYLGGIYNIASAPGNGYVGGMNITTTNNREIGFFVTGTTAVSKMTTAGLQVTGSANISNGVKVAAGGLQVAGIVPDISSPYNNSPMIIDLASGQVYGPVIRSAAGSFNFAGHSLDQGGTYLGGVYGLANNPGSLGFLDGINFATVGSRNLGFNINNTLIGKFSLAGLEVTGSINGSSTIIARTGFSGSLTKLTDGTSYLIAGTGMNVTTGSNGAVTLGINNSVVATISGSRFTGDIISATDIIASGNLKSLFSSGDEGGEINLALAQTNTTLTGSVTIDVYQNRLRIFESGGTNRGGYYDISTLGAGVGTNLAGSSPGGSSGQVQYNNAGNFGGATNVSIGGGDLVLTENTSPTTPASNAVKVFAQAVAGRELISGLGASGRAYSYQPHTGRSKYGIWMINGGSISLTADGIGAPSATGTVTVRTPTLTGFASSLRRVGFVTATTANAPAGWRLGATWFWRGDDTNRGGFHYITRFIPSNATTTLSGRYFIGMNGANTGTAATEPSNWVNIIGMGCNSGSANFSIMHNDGSGAATTIDLGSNFSAVSSSIDVYELALYCPPSGSSVDWRVENFTKNAVVTGSITTNLPASTQGLNLLGYTETGGAVAVALDLISMYIETEF